MHPEKFLRIGPGCRRISPEVNFVFTTSFRMLPIAPSARSFSGGASMRYTCTSGITDDVLFAHSAVTVAMNKPKKKAFTQCDSTGKNR